MGDFDFRDNLVTLARFSTPAEAAIVQARLAREGIETTLEESHTATMLSGGGVEAWGPKLLVRQRDLWRARELIQPEDEIDDLDDVDDYDATDWSGEDWDDQYDDDDLYEEEYPETPPLTRAFRSAVIGAIAVPLLVLNLHSMVLIFRHRLWEPQPGEVSTNWRYYLALLFNLIGAIIFWLILSAYRR